MATSTTESLPAMVGDPGSVTPFAVSPKEAARLLNVTPGALANWRSRGRGPAYCRVEGSGSQLYRIMYLVDDLRAYVAADRVVPGGQA